MIIQDDNIKMNNIKEITIALKNTLTNRRYLSNLNKAKINRLELPTNEVVSNGMEFIDALQTITV